MYFVAKYWAPWREGSGRQHVDEGGDLEQIAGQWLAFDILFLDCGKLGLGLVPLLGLLGEVFCAGGGRHA